MAKSTIKLTRKIRNEFTGCSSSYITKGHAINAFDGVLQGYDLCLDRENLLGFDGYEGFKSIEVQDEFRHCAGVAYIIWYRIPSGRYEFIGYVT